MILDDATIADMKAKRARDKARDGGPTDRDREGRRADRLAGGHAAMAAMGGVGGRQGLTGITARAHQNSLSRQKRQQA